MCVRRIASGLTGAGLRRGDYGIFASEISRASEIRLLQAIETGVPLDPPYAVFVLPNDNITENVQTRNELVRAVKAMYLAENEGTDAATHRCNVHVEYCGICNHAFLVLNFLAD